MPKRIKRNEVGTSRNTDRLSGIDDDEVAVILNEDGEAMPMETVESLKVELNKMKSINQKLYQSPLNWHRSAAIVDIPFRMWRWTRIVSVVDSRQAGLHLPRHHTRRYGTVGCTSRCRTVPDSDRWKHLSTIRIWVSMDAIRWCWFEVDQRWEETWV